MEVLHIGFDNFMSICLTCITTLFSVNISVFTLTVAFLFNKKESIKLILKQINENGISLSLSGKYNAAQMYIQKMRFITTTALIGVILSIIGGFTYIVFLFIPHSYWALIILVPIILSVFCCGISLSKLFYWYLKN